MSFLDPLLGAIANGAEVTQLGAIGYGAELSYVHKTCLAQLVELKAFNFGCGSSPMIGMFSYFFFVFDTVFLLSRFSFMSPICPSRFISYPDFLFL
jgi:hypothetical protein